MQILVIKHGALGDVILSFHALAAIRKHYPEAHIVVLTTSPYKGFYEKCPDCDEVFVDDRPKWWQFYGILSLWQFFKTRKFDLIFDLQASGRTSLYYRFLPNVRQSKWCGIAPGCFYFDPSTDRKQTHSFERYQRQLAVAGIPAYGRADLSWMVNLKSEHSVATPYILLIPGGSAHRPKKRWPIHFYIKLANILSERGYMPVFIGGKDEKDIAAMVEDLPFTSVNLLGKTNFYDLAALATKAKMSIGNDTGPMHLIAALDCPSLVLFSSESNPVMCSPRGIHVDVMQHDDLKNLSVEDVVTQIEKAFLGKE